ncbi:uncharacterized protein LOC116196365 [Punica granatum]|uniref:Uncharacterized protein LOC116196365 n=1 Tax=Punica granatum TaxID=22663 RepID=A0A6P8CDB2_PUNGR|nr:uncharacterized protein LOC116196365 [Punica granatum]
MKLPLAVAAASFLLILFGVSYSSGAVDLPRHVDVTASRRELKENSFGHHPEHKSNAGDMDLDDYHRIDPSPSSKAIQPGPIQHGTPLMPFIPEPSPPSPPAPG